MVELPASKQPRVDRTLGTGRIYLVFGEEGREREEIARSCVEKALKEYGEIPLGRNRTVLLQCKKGENFPVSVEKTVVRLSGHDCPPWTNYVDIIRDLLRHNSAVLHIKDVDYAPNPVEIREFVKVVFFATASVVVEGRMEPRSASLMESASFARRTEFRPTAQLRAWLNIQAP